MNQSREVPINDHVQEGLQHVIGQAATGRAGAWIGRGALGGFALVVGGVGPGVVRLDNGACVVALPLSPEGLRALVTRGSSLLGSLPPLPEGLVMG